MVGVSFPGDQGEVAGLIRARDWSGFPLGLPAQWPDVLRHAIEMILPAHSEIVLFWGPDFLAFYNDTYAPTIGDKHPDALGRPAHEYWSELWDDLGPLLRRVMETGETISARDRPFYIERHGYPETVYFDISYSPLRNGAGGVDGVLCLVRETTSQVRAKAALVENESRFAAIVSSSEDAILSTDLDMHITSWNNGAQMLYGYSADEVMGELVTLLVPNDRGDEEPNIIASIRRGERVFPYETQRQHKDGGLIDVSLTVSPILDEGGHVVGASKIARDITERKRAERLQNVVLREMQHRVKNIFATVQAIARQTFRNHDDIAAAIQAFDGRVLAMTRAHALLYNKSWDGADLAAVIGQATAAYDSEKFEIYGPEVRLSPRAALSLSLALHELATNAAKYGALSGPEGKVRIVWQHMPGTPSMLHLAWKETGGPSVVVPTRKGFGSRLIQDILAAELNGDVAVVYESDGLRCVIDAPLETGWES